MDVDGKMHKRTLEIMKLLNAAQINKFGCVVVVYYAYEKINKDLYLIKGKSLSDNIDSEYFFVTPSSVYGCCFSKSESEMTENKKWDNENKLYAYLSNN